MALQYEDRKLQKSLLRRHQYFYTVIMLSVSATPGKYGYSVNTGWINNFNCHLKDKHSMVAILCGTENKQTNKKKANSQYRT